MPNLAALRAAVFLLSAKNRWGGHLCAPPGRARVNGYAHYRFGNGSQHPRNVPRNIDVTAFYEFSPDFLHGYINCDEIRTSSLSRACCADPIPDYCQIRKFRAVGRM